MTSDFNRVGGVILVSCLVIRVVCVVEKGVRPGTSISRATRSASTEELVWVLGVGVCLVLCEACSVDEGRCVGWGSGCGRWFTLFENRIGEIVEFICYVDESPSGGRGRLPL
jgi:hypothetical protein